MPIFFQHQINESAKLVIWHISDPESFFTKSIAIKSIITNETKRLQHLAGRFLLQILEPDFPVSAIQQPTFGKPYLPNNEFQFSISHCGDFAAALISKNQKVGIDIELTTDRVLKVTDKFLSENEKKIFSNSLQPFDASLKTLLWSAKESVFKWYGEGGVNFQEQIQVQQLNENENTIECFFSKTNQQLIIHYRQFENLWLTWVHA